MGWQLHRRVQLLRCLTHRVCLNAAPQARSEFHGAAHARAPQAALGVCAAKHKGRGQQGRLSLGYVSLATKERYLARRGESRHSAR